MTNKIQVSGQQQEGHYADESVRAQPDDIISNKNNIVKNVNIPQEAYNRIVKYAGKNKDCLYYICSLLYSKISLNSDYKNRDSLSSKTMKFLIGNDYKKYLEILDKELEIICVESKSYNVMYKLCKKYKFYDDIDLCETSCVAIKSFVLLRRIKKFNELCVKNGWSNRSNSFDDDCQKDSDNDNNGCPKSIRSNKINITKKFYKNIPRINKDKAISILDGLLSFGKITSNGYKHQLSIINLIYNGIRASEDKNGRLYWIVTSLKKDLRLALFPDIVEVDIDASQPTFMLSFLMDLVDAPVKTMCKNIFKSFKGNSIIKDLDNYAVGIKLSDNRTIHLRNSLRFISGYVAKNNKKIGKEIRTMKKLLRSGGFYEALALTGVFRSREDAKIGYMFFQNDGKFSAGAKAMSILFPCITFLVHRIKYIFSAKFVHGSITRRESDYIFAVQKKIDARKNGKKIYIATIHDSWLTKDEHVRVVKRAARKVAKKMFKGFLPSFSKKVISNLVVYLGKLYEKFKDNLIFYKNAVKNSVTSFGDNIKNNIDLMLLGLKIHSPPMY